MNRQSKEAVVAEFAEKLQATKAAYLADYRGLNVEQATALRCKLHEAGVEYRVVKNTLLRLAAKGSDAECLDEFLVGPTAIAFAKEDPVAPAKALVEFAKSHEAFELKAGVLDGKLLSPADIKALSDLPSREELLAKMLGSMSAPASNFVGVLAAIPRSMVQVLSAIKDQKEAA
ncbi:MAG: 50S ribosomal protein L10 [Deltaproteobacteria bacterium]|nr:50S ribosomal protein L10 [Deltaproteobacteria bacterium]MBW2475733.1 50S ribosomal protein L10 [Deltaproteobacteria bacterium]MBW2504417.1 50S ribosomal protein L10 [Deltaproteobacteria bacterium]